LELCEELYARGFKVAPVSVKESNSKKWKINYENKTLIPPFNVIDGLGEIVAKTIVKERNEKPFISVEDFKKRGGVNKASIQELTDIGSLKGMSERNQLSLF
jgi:DNA polymerase-3 subunit alpha (Gram-positive type)